MADWALCVYIILLFLFIAVVPGIQLTLPGIAGIILGIGMAVDANVVIFERVKEEVRPGPPDDSRCAHRLQKRHERPWLDANVTSHHRRRGAAVYGTGSVQGFATTLLLGVITSHDHGHFVTRFLLTRFVRVFHEPRLFVAVKPAADAAVEGEAK